MKTTVYTLGLVATMLLAACESMQPKTPPAPPPPQPLSIEDAVEVTAVVQKVDLATRKVSLLGEDGRAFTVVVDPAVENLPQMKVGDKVKATYREAIGATIFRDGQAPEAGVALSGQTAKPGERPAADVSAVTTIPVTVTAVDTTNNTVTFFGDDGLVRAITVQTPEAKAFIKQLKQGDRVVVTFTEAFAIKVVPAG